MIEFFKFEQIRILEKELKYPEDKNNFFQGYYGFKIAKLVKNPKVLVIVEPIRLKSWTTIPVRKISKKDIQRFYKAENSNNWNNLYSEDPELLSRVYGALPKVSGPQDLGNYEALAQDRMYLLI